MKSVSEAMRDYLQTHPYNIGDPDCENILDLLYRAYAETHESDPPEIQSGFAELEEFLKTLPLDDNNAVFNLTCQLCTAYEHKAFLDRCGNCGKFFIINCPNFRSICSIIKRYCREYFGYNNNVDERININSVDEMLVR